MSSQNNDPAPLALPDPHQRLLVPMPDGARISVRRHGNQAGPRLILSHGNGFAIDGYYAFWRLFLERFEVVVYDQRNHGDSPYCGGRGHHHAGFANDQRLVRQAAAQEWGDKATYGLFHSLSAAAALIDCQQHGMDWEGLVLFDPPMVPPPSADPDLHAEAARMEDFMTRWALDRPDRFADPAALAAQFASVRSLAGWAPGSHLLMAQATLRQEAESGDWVLRCPRAIEAATYAMNAFPQIYDHLDRLVPFADRILFLMSDPDLAGSKPPGRVARLFAQQYGLTARWLSGTDHLLQLEQPARVHAAVLAFLEQTGCPIGDLA